jgi:maltose/moltooligosaccharide transporter
LFWFGLNKDAVNDSNIPHITVIAFLIGSVLSLTTVWWSVHAIPELPLSPNEKEAILAKPRGLAATLAEVVEAVRDMPQAMRQLWWMKLFQWYGMMCYWIYLVPALALSVFETTDAGSQGFRDAGLLNGQIGGFYNFVAFGAAFGLIPFTKRFGPKLVHAVCLALAGLGMWWLPTLKDSMLLFIPMVGIGLAWASIMGNPYIMLARSIPPERAGVYMGIFNMFIVLPMIIQMLTLPLFYGNVLNGDPRHVIQLAGCFLGVAALLTLRVKTDD